MAIADQARVGIAPPQAFPKGPAEPNLIIRFAQRAEVLGYDSLWVQDRMLGHATWLEPLNMLSFMAAATNTIRLGVATLPLPWHNPVRLAKALVTLDQLSGGRLTVGLSLGGTYLNDTIVGAVPERRLPAFNESLRLMRLLWTEEDFDFNGEFWTLRNATMDPKPAQSAGKGHMPIILGGGHPDAIRRSVRVADGWVGAASSTVESFKEQVTLVNQALDEYGRDPSTFTIAKKQFLALDDNVERATKRMRDWAGHSIMNADLGERVSLRGPSSVIVEGLQQIVDAGANMLILNPVDELLDQIEHLALIMGMRQEFEI
mgnify:FL=1